MQAQINNKNSGEDLKTASLLGLMRYLECELFFKIFQNSLIVNSAKEDALEDPKLIDEFKFWPKWDAEGTGNTNYVEPDVYVKFDNFHLIIELKLNDSPSQYIEQWEKEIRSLKNNVGNQDDKPIVVWAIGGNVTNGLELVHLPEQKPIQVYKVSWVNLYNSVLSIRDRFEGSSNQKRLLEDICKAFHFYGYHPVSWFSNLESLDIKYEPNYFQQWQKQI